MTNTINQKLIEQALTYQEYRDLIDQLMLENKTTGPIQEGWLIDYAKLNIARMKKWEKKTQILPDIASQIKNISGPLLFLTISEGWCGDAAQIVPIIEKLSSLNNAIEHRIILRDEHLDVMDLFLTNGGRAIPIIVIIQKSNLEILGHWGPRPIEAQQIMNALKTNPELKKEDLAETLHAWYAKDNAISVQKEFFNYVLEILKTIKVQTN
jgi:hypothetical protein